MTVRVDPAALGAAADHLGSVATGLDLTAGAIPTVVDGGDATTALAGFLSVFAGQGAELTTGLSNFAGVLQGCAQHYREQDLASADALNTTAWGR